MSLLRATREIEILNKLIRFTLKHAQKHPGRLLQELQRRWPTYGLTDCEFRGIKFKMFNKCDDQLVHYFYYDVPYNEAADLSLFIELSKASRCALDIGANTGLFSILSCIANPHLKMYSFEPYRVNADRLRMNLKANRLDDVNIVNEALGEKIGTLDMSVPKNGSVSLVASANQQFAKSIHPDLEWTTAAVSINTIDNFNEKLGRPIDLIKCDVETFEMSVFKGAYNTLRTDRPTIIFECFLDDERRRFFNAILQDFGYFLYLIREEGIAYSKGGFPETNNGMNFLIAPVRPIRDFIGYEHMDLIRSEILLRPGA